MENDIRDDDRMLELASKIDDDQPIDWPTVEVGARDEEERAVLAELRLLAALTKISRDPDAAGQMTDPVQPATPSPIPVTWGSLTILELVGQGGYARVYRARDNLDREVALKLFPVASEASTEIANRVLREGSLLAKVKHQNVVVVHGVDRAGDFVGLWMEFINGRTLEEELRTRGTLSADEATTIGIDLCRALAAVHSRGLLHRDIKAPNVMREEGGRTVLMDFGSGSEQTTGTTRPLDVAGTPLYLAPELFDRQPATRASDIYSLGVLLYRMVTGGYPVDGANRTEIKRVHRAMKRRHLRDARPDLPDGFVRVVERALAPSPKQRYRTAGEFEAALADYNSQVPWLVWARRAAAVAAVMLLVAIPAWLILRSRTGATDPASSTSVEPPPAPEPVSAGMAPYTIHAAFFRQRDQHETQLGPGDRVAPGDAVGMRIEASTAVHAYVMTVDDRGEKHLLFPVPGLKPDNPLPPAQRHQLPGSRDDEQILWQVSSVGGREHFLVLASPTALTPFEPMLRSLPAPKSGQPISYSRVPDDVMGQLRGEMIKLRGIGGLVAAPKKADATSPWFEAFDQLPREAEKVRGPWIRQMTLVNPGK